ncbi:MAG: OmpA family protein [Acidobacteriota bacterium]|nr:OmpA family protein [Acidobacteriota bacterium]
MARRKKHAGHVNHERWLVSYADFITLLFAFFVVLFSSSQVDHRKITKLARAIQDAFQQLGIFENAYKRPPLESGGSIPVDQMRLVNSHIAPEQMFGAMAAASWSLSTQKSMAEIRKALEKDLAPEIRRHVVAIGARPDGLVISLREIGFYASGSANLKPSSLPAVQRIALVLLNRPEDIRIEGHTDNVPIHNTEFASNWELSTARATGMVRLFITQFRFPAERLSAAGYANYHPVASNATVAGRARNRRVDIVVLAPRAPIPMSSLAENDEASQVQPAAQQATGASPERAPVSVQPELPSAATGSRPLKGPPPAPE